MGRRDVIFSRHHDEISHALPWPPSCFYAHCSSHSRCSLHFRVSGGHFRVGCVAHGHHPGCDTAKAGAIARRACGGSQQERLRLYIRRSVRCVASAGSASGIEDE